MTGSRTSELASNSTTSKSKLRKMMEGKTAAAPTAAVVTQETEDGDLNDEGEGFDENSESDVEEMEEIDESDDELELSLNTKRCADSDSETTAHDNATKKHKEMSAAEKAKWSCVF